MARKTDYSELKEGQAYELLLKTCRSIDASQDEKTLNSLNLEFSKSSEEFKKRLAAFNHSIAQQPLSFFVMLWAGLTHKDKVFGGRYLEMLSELIQARILPLVINKTHSITLQVLSEQNPTHIIDNIRCYRDWSITKREDGVLVYKAFSDWLSQETFGYVPLARDVDRIVTNIRSISFETYIKILSHMDLREQILAKIFYLGGHRALEEVLSLKIEDVNFSNSLIHFSEDISYPRHLFEDIKEYIAGRKKGFVFVGRDGERVALTTPFRSLKTVASELKLHPEFTFKDFTRNI